MQALDAYTLAHLAKELDGFLRGGKINKIQQPSRHEFLLTLWGAKVSGRLYVNLNPESPCCFLLKPNQKIDFIQTTLSKPTGFCMLLRKHLIAARVESISVIPGERVLNITFDSLNEIGQHLDLVLSLELMGKHSNMLLYDQRQGIILGTAHLVTEQMSSLRELASGLPYLPPPQPAGKLAFHEASEEVFQTILQNLQGNTPAEKIRELLQAFWGLSRNLLEDILAANHGWDTIYRDLKAIEAGQWLNPGLQTDKKRFSLIAPQDEPMWCYAPTIHEMVAQFFGHALQEKILFQLKRRLEKIIEEEQKRLIKQQQCMTPVSAVEIEQFQKMGDRLLSAFSAREILPNPLDYPLQHKISLTDYETQEEIVIEFDPLLSWVENAQRYYRKAKKAKSQQLIAETFKKKLETELAYLQELQVLLDQTETIEDLKALENDFVHAGLLNGEGFKKSEQQKASKVSGILELCSSEGFPILVGKTGTANELIVGKLAKPHDLWIHVHEMPGSHVLVRTEKREVPNQTLWEAANLAVHYSSARHGKNIPIIYTQGRYVRKIPDSYPGHVTYQHEKSAFITPDEGLLKQLHQGFIQS